MLGEVKDAKYHIDFIVGRGRKTHSGELNIPLNPLFLTRNTVYIDADKSLQPDIGQELYKINFEVFGITREQDPDNAISVRVLFDYSSFYCGAIQSIHTISTQLKRPYKVYVPLPPNEHKVPTDMTGILWHKCYKFELACGKYPLFDWSAENIASSNRPISEFVNAREFVVIHCLEKKKHINLINLAPQIHVS